MYYFYKDEPPFEWQMFPHLAAPLRRELLLRPKNEQVAEASNQRRRLVFGGKRKSRESGERRVLPNRVR